MKEQHVVLGAGVIGKELVKTLKSDGKNVVGASKTTNNRAGFDVAVDLLDMSETLRALDSASHVYLCAGLPYSTKVWQRDWPLLVSNVINACIKHNAKLIFFDNMYMYGPSPLPVPFNEETTQEPPAKKGDARKAGSDLVLNAIENNGLTALIARSADFYGPDAPNSMLHTQFLEKMVVGKNPGWIGAEGAKHNYAFTLDNTRAMSMLASDDSAYGQTWHLPVSRHVTANEIVVICSSLLGKNFKVSYMPRPMMRILGLFISPLKELNEMMYQHDNEYVMDDSKFMNKYSDFSKTSLEDGLKDMINAYSVGE